MWGVLEPLLQPFVTPETVPLHPVTTAPPSPPHHPRRMHACYPHHCFPPALLPLLPSLPATCFCMYQLYYLYAMTLV